MVAVFHVFGGYHLIVGRPPFRLETYLGEDGFNVVLVFRQVGKNNLRILFVDIFQCAGVEGLDNEPVTKVL